MRKASNKRRGVTIFHIGRSIASGLWVEGIKTSTPSQVTLSYPLQPFPKRQPCMSSINPDAVYESPSWCEGHRLHVEWDQPPAHPPPPPRATRRKRAWFVWFV